MRVAYLSGALRISTAPDAEVEGGRLVRGGMQGFAQAGWEVEPYIAGDRRWGRIFAGRGREAMVQAAPWRAAAADVVRLGAASWNFLIAPRAVRARPDLAYERFASYQALGRAFQRQGVPWVVETSGPFYREAKVERRTLAFAGLARRRELATYRNADMVVCVSEPLRRFLVDEGVPEALTYVRPNGVDVDLFDPGIRSGDARTDALTVGFVGSLLPWQGLDSLLRAMAIARARGVEVRADIVGDGAARRDLVSLAGELGLAEVIRFRGLVPWKEVPAAIAEFDVGFAGHLPILDGAMYHSPLKLYEYSAMGKPILSTRHPQAAELMAEVGCGYLFEGAEELADQIAAAADDLAILRSRRDEIRATIVRGHTWLRRITDMLAELRARGLLPAAEAA